MVQSGVSILIKFILVLALFSSLFSSDLKTEKKIYGVILHTLLPHKTDIKVWCADKTKEDLFKDMQGVECITSAIKADFILLSKELKIKSDAIKFVTSYKLLQVEKTSAVGGFFWQKGRPNVLFLRKNLQAHKITLPPSMQEFIEDEL